MKTRSIDVTKTVATTIAIVSAVVTIVALLLVNVFDVTAFMDIMRAGTLMFIMSGAYLIGYNDGVDQTKVRWGIHDRIDLGTGVSLIDLHDENPIVLVDEDEAE